LGSAIALPLYALAGCAAVLLARVVAWSRVVWTA
jgi:hypothetical protein